MRLNAILACLLAMLLLSACGALPGRWDGIAMRECPADSARGNEVALYAMGLVDTAYRFGSKEPEAGLDCSYYAKRHDMARASFD